MSTPATNVKSSAEDTGALFLSVQFCRTLRKVYRAHGSEDLFMQSQMVQRLQEKMSDYGWDLEALRID